MSSASRLAIFDCDGTLIDGQASICNAMDSAFAEFGLTPPKRNDVRRIVGLSLPQALSRLLPDADADQGAVVAEAYKRAFRAAREAGELSQPLYDGMAQVLARLRTAGWSLGVATGMSRRGLDHVLAMHDLIDCFCTLQTADDHPSKPHPAMAEAALLEAGAQARDAVMIGDTAYDMQMARDAGVRPIGVGWGYHTPRELRDAGAEIVVETPGELAGYLLR